MIPSSVHVFAYIRHFTSLRRSDNYLSIGRHTFQCAHHHKFTHLLLAPPDARHLPVVVLFSLLGVLLLAFHILCSVICNAK